MSSSSYSFNSMSRIGSDVTDETQKNIQNTRFSTHMLSDYHSDKSTDSYVKFSLDQPTMLMSGTNISSSVIDDNSKLLLNTEQGRSFERVQLFQRPFVTVPYLGRGSADPTLESQMQQGENISDKKSVSTIMEKSFNGYSLYPLDDNMEERTHTTDHIIQESALDGWVRGGQNTRRSANV